MSIFQNTCKPVGFFGRLMLASMNMGHKRVHTWGLSELRLEKDDQCLDIGCGGGSNIKRLLKLVPDGYVDGIDYSEESVKKSIKKNKEAVKSSKSRIRLMDVDDLKIEPNSYDVATAFETIYFWPDIDKALKGIYNILRPNGRLLICNETNGKDPKQNKWADIINGMNIYTMEDLRGLLIKAGFKIDKEMENEKGYLLIIASK